MKSAPAIFSYILCLALTPGWTKAAETAASKGDTLVKTAPVIPANETEVELDQPVLVAQASPEVKDWGPYRMPKVFKLPGGEICCTFAVGFDTCKEQGKDSPAYLSKDEGKTWQLSTFPHPRLKGMNPLIMPINDGEYYCIPAGNGLPLDAAKSPKPQGVWKDGYGNVNSLYLLEDCPPEVIKWFKDNQAMRWSPKTKSWAEEAVQWDHQGQLMWCMKDGFGQFGQRVYLEVPVVRAGKELFHVDYWTLFLTKEGQIPLSWDCSLMVSNDNGHSWSRRSTVVKAREQDPMSEPCLALNQAGELVSVIRRDEGVAHPMFLVHSKDRGFTWGEPQELFEFGVFPNLLQLENGVLALSFGRPGVWLSFSLDGGHSWTKPQAIIEGNRKEPMKHSCGYTSMLALNKNSFLLAYGDFLLPNAKGEPCRSILTRKITVEPNQHAR